MTVNIPLIESPFFRDAFSPDQTDPHLWRLAEALHNDGYAVIDFPDPDFETGVEAIRDHLHGQYNWDDYFAGKVEGLRIQDAWRFDEHVRAIAANTQILELLSQLYGRQAFPFQTLNFPVGTQQHSHSDSFHFSSAPERFVCGVWVAFEDISADAGPLVYYPGSHKLPIYTNEHIGRVPSRTDDTYSNYDLHTRFCERLVEAYQLEPLEFLPKKGQALIWTANLLHGGSAQRDRQLTRWSQVTHYYFEDCAYYSPIGSIPLLGSIDYRSVVDIRTGETVAPSLNGEPLTPAIVQRVGRTFDEVQPFIPPDFDDDLYLRLHPDVAAAGLNPKEHYLSYGFQERRGYKH